MTTVDDNAADRVIVLGSGLADEYTLNTEAPDVDTGFYRKIRASRRVLGQSTYAYELIVGGSLRAEGECCASRPATAPTASTPHRSAPCRPCRWAARRRP